MQPTTPSFQQMEDTLRDACERATQLVFPLLTMLRLYRSVVALTRELMQTRSDKGLSPALSPDQVALLEKVRDSVGFHFPDPNMPVSDALILHATMIKLSRIARRARLGQLTGRLPRAQRAEPTPPPEAPPKQPNTRAPMPAPPVRAFCEPPAAPGFRTKLLGTAAMRDRPGDGLAAALAASIDANLATRPHTP